MSDLLAYESWIKRTAVRGRRRSNLLKEVDRQLQHYEKFPQHPNKLAVKESLRAWMDSKKPSGSWVANSRNQDGAITELWNHVNRGVGPNDDERAALELMKTARTEFLVNLFEGTKLASHNFIESGGHVAAYASSLRTGINAVRDQEAAGRAQHLGRGAYTGTLYTNAWGRVTEAFQGADFSDILNLPEFMSDVSAAIGLSLSELSTGMVAGAGLLKSSVKTVYYGYKTGKSGWEKHKLNTYSDVINEGDPTAAFVGLQKVINQELALNASILTTHAAETGAKAGGMFLDAGAGTSAIAGLAGTIARLVVNIGFMASDWKEAYQANKILRSPEQIDATIFQKCPVLGCYFLCCADTSMIVSLMFEDIVTKKAFKDVIEHAVRTQLDPTLKIASHALYRHRMRLTGKKLPKLTVLESASNKSANNPTGDIFYLKATGQIAMRDAGWDDRLTARISNLKNLRGKNAKFH